MEYESARHLLHRSRSTQWFGTDHTVNLYRGCCHGCLYCDSRSDCYRVGDFDRVRGKRDALRILRDDLARKVRPAFINMGAMSDPYNPFEGELLFTRHALELIDAYGCGVAVATKSDLITRDIDLLGAIQEHAPVVCKLTVTTTDETLAARLEPNAPSPARRLEALRALSSAGIFSGALLMPVLPFLEDSDENVLAVVEGGARGGGPVHLSGVRCHHAAGPAGIFSGRAGACLSRTGAEGPVSEAVWGSLSVRQPPGQAPVERVYRSLPGAGHSIRYEIHHPGGHSALWRPADELFPGGVKGLPRGDRGSRY